MYFSYSQISNNPYTYKFFITFAKSNLKQLFMQFKFYVQEFFQI